MNQTSRELHSAVSFLSLTNSEKSKIISDFAVEWHSVFSVSNVLSIIVKKCLYEIQDENNEVKYSDAYTRDEILYTIEGLVTLMLKLDIVIDRQRGVFQIDCDINDGPKKLWPVLSELCNHYLENNNLGVEVDIDYLKDIKDI